ncbi:hypothetical protein AB0Y04_11935 [Loigolactobacillus coryniformis]|jgi:hypothetical protein|uniref:Uncharacterized protein n=4 Tax=Loigolactobacillus coryniformis TaxID=1610 RepID=A0A0R1F573_9LACO|nr:hypothetical protein [Loigolactobacillus coryniformis]MDT3391790.1 hypothetical protein [Bacillota bacterium]OEH91039.1 hypothetical protein ATO00_00160 [Loigolactobacillus coryniformis subsp. coryniformis]RRG06950.1 MAG: hypothetical protein DUD28_01375 [Lactobacillus sp.]ATO42748.1 hypothetical protein LC20004_01895 [Loigolactobacillus coryniformis subsp. torquens DSM 20004 = KCTC 3535]ATO54459.1 hypothetical protein LC20001_01895 [Loigolactobacillus coryniformis subsp. coryniformis KCTC 
MMTVFDVLKMVTINHMPVDVQQIVMTDTDGKPNSVLTDLLNDVLGKVRIFIDLQEMTGVSQLVNELKMFTPLPTDVLDEYTKILEQPVSSINFAPRKQQIELVYDEYTY